ncbi:MAG TPA: hypothetical protein DEA43_02770 [Candidatus Moranbacteria bacterium]|nr:hypothetical protein [Candidatus Moranbacteria bacterium]
MVLESLAKGPQKGVDLIEEIKTIRKGTTKQGIYKAFRSLIKEKAIVKYRKNLMLNQIWLNKLDKFIKQTDENYLNKENKKVIDTLDWMTKGSKISYVFNSYDSLDKFHSHIFSLIIKRTDSQAPIYVYNPHEWFVLKTGLKENEDYLIDWLGERNRQLYFTIGHETILDKKFRDAYSSEKLEIAIDESMNYPENYYVNVIGDYVIEMKNDTMLAEKLDAIYIDSINEVEASEKIKTLLKTKHKVRMVLSCDTQKAKKIKAKLGRNFLIPVDLKDK